MLGLTTVAAGIIVAQLGWAERGHQPTALEWALQVAVLLAALVVMGRVITAKN